MPPNGPRDTLAELVPDIEGAPLASASGNTPSASRNQPSTGGRATALSPLAIVGTSCAGAIAARPAATRGTAARRSRVLTPVFGNSKKLTPNNASLHAPNHERGLGVVLYQ